MTYPRTVECIRRYGCPAVVNGGVDRGLTNCTLARSTTSVIPKDMDKPLKIVAVGDSTGIILPEDILASLNLDRDNELYPVKTSDGIEAHRCDPEFEGQMDAARSVMERRRTALRELAK